MALLTNVESILSIEDVSSLEVDSITRTEDLGINSLSRLVMAIWTVVTCQVKNQSRILPGERL